MPFSTMVEAEAPLREFGPWLGVVASPRPRVAPGQVNLDAARLALIQRLLEQAHQTAPDWLAAWQPLADAITAQVVELLRTQAATAALVSLAPERVASHALPAEDDIRILHARIASAGIPLEQAVAGIRTDFPTEQSFPSVGGAVEESWLALERVVASIVGEWSARVAEVERWRRPTAWLWVATLGTLTVTLLVGLAIGGFLKAPAWFQPVIRWWWSLPWP